MARYTIFLLPSGMGFGHIDYEPSDEERAQAGMAYVEGDYPTDHYYLAKGVPRSRPRLRALVDPEIVADDQDTIVLDVPQGTVVGWETPEGRQEHIINDGKVEWSTAYPGTHYVLIRPPFPWVTLDLKVTAHAPA